MAVTATAIYPQLILSPSAQIVAATGTNKVALYTPVNANGSVVKSILVCNTDTLAYTLQLFATTGGTDYLLGTFTIPANAGNVAGTQAVNLLQNMSLSYDMAGNQELYVGNGTVLKIATTSTVTAAKAIQATVTEGGDF